MSPHLCTVIFFIMKALQGFLGAFRIKPTFLWRMLVSYNILPALAFGSYSLTCLPLCSERKETPQSPPATGGHSPLPLCVSCPLRRTSSLVSFCMNSPLLLRQIAINHWLNQTQMYFPTVPMSWVWRLKSSFWQGRFLSEGSRKNTFSWLFQLLEAACFPWLMAGLLPLNANNVWFNYF